MVKGGSTTLNTIFHTFGYVRNLSYVLPVKNRIYLGWPYQIKKEFFRPAINGPFNIFCEHSVFNKTAMSEFMPRDTIYVTSVREPFSHFKSVYNYYKVGQISIAGQDENVGQFLRDAAIYDSIYKSHGKMNERSCVPDNFSMTRNLQSHIFGIPVGYPQGTLDVSRQPLQLVHYITKRFKEYDLVIVLEYLNESLVLLKRLMCWSLRDIIYKPANVLQYVQKLDDGQENKNIYRKWSSADHMLYDHANITLWNKIALAGNDFKMEVAQFEQIQSNVTEFCTSDVKKEYIYIPQKCNTGWTKLDTSGASFMLPSTTRSFSDAKAACVANESKLASIHSDVENNFLIELMAGCSYSVIWIGLTNDLTWVDGSSYDFKNEGRNKLVSRNSNGPLKCAKLVQHNDHYDWKEAACSEQLNFVCRKVFIDLSKGATVHVFDGENPLALRYDSKWSDAIARVACAEAGYEGGRAISSRLYGEMAVVISKNIQHMMVKMFPCYRTKTKDCCGKTTDRLTSYYAAVAVCDINGTKFYSANVKNNRVYSEIQNVERGICGDSFTEHDALVSCRSAPDTQTAIAIPGEFFETEITPNVWFASLGCSGSENSLFECPSAMTIGADVSPTSCNSSAMAVCADKYTVSARNGNIGSVLIQAGAYAYFALPETFGADEAKALCMSTPTSVGAFTKGLPYKHVIPAANKTTIKVVIDCEAGVTDITKCRTRIKVDSNDTVAGVVCYNGMEPVISNTHYGNVMVELSNAKYTISARLGEFEAKTICDQKQYSFGVPYAYNIPSNKITTIPELQLSFGCSQQMPKIEMCNAEIKNIIVEKIAGVFCFKDPGSLPVGTNYGSVTLTVGSTTHFISAKDWGTTEASALCKGQGFRRGLPYINSTDVDSSKPLLSYQCDTVKAKIADCTFTVVAPQSQKFKVAAALCYDVFEPALNEQTFGGVTVRTNFQSNGSYEIYPSTDGWSNDEAGTVCRNLSFTHGIGFISSLPASKSGVRLAMNCTSSMSRVQECQIRVLYSDTLTKVAEAFCYSEADMFSEQKPYGRVMIKVRSAKFSISYDGWGLNERTAFCNALSLKRGIGFPAEAKDEQKAFGLNITYACEKTATKLNDCTLLVQRGVISHTASVVCYDNLVPSLESGNFGTITVNLTKTNYTSPIKANSLSVSTAGTICSHLTTPAAKGFRYTSSLEKETNWSLTFECEEVKSALDECTPKLLFERQSRAASVFCYNQFGLTNVTYGMLKVNTTNVGEVLYVSPLGWGEEETIVACRGLGYSTGRTYNTTAVNVTSPLSIMFDCENTEPSLENCTFRIKKVENTAFINIVCHDSKVKLSNRTFGAVQVRAGNKHYLINAYEWGKEEAEVLCKAQGLPKWFQYAGPGTYLTFNIRCSGSEEAIEDCNFDPFGYQVNETVQMFCYESFQALLWNTHGPVGLKANKNVFYISSVGNYSVFANTTCKEFGFDYGFSYRVNPSRIGVPNNVVVAFNCLGNETGILECPAKVLVGNHLHVLSVSCHKNDAVFFTHKKEGDFITPMVEEKYYFSTISWHRKEAEILCKQFGYTHGLISSVVQSDVPANVTFGYNCSSHELSSITHLENCTAFARDWPTTNETAVAFCCNDAHASIEFVNHGRPGVTVDGVLHHIANTTWSGRHATALCRGLGFYSGCHFSGEAYGRGVAPLQPDSNNKSLYFKCDGDETSLLGCRIFFEKAEPRVPAAAVCFNDQNHFKEYVAVNYTLQADSTESQVNATVMVEQHGVAGYLCDPNGDLSLLETYLLCLGLVGKWSRAVASGAASIPFNNSNPTWFGGGPALSAPSQIEDCRLPWVNPNSSCTAVDQDGFMNVKYVTCSKGFLLRLNPGPHRGTVEVNDKGYEWEKLVTIRKSAWTLDVLTPICQHLGYEFGRILPSSSNKNQSGICLNSTACVNSPDFLCESEKECLKGYAKDVSWCFSIKPVVKRSVA
ncbi:uncharacterized protein LOC135483002 [Lineus longissimus]|uniref:uncharacterized protein LOC135483002 n=1 Tax=Lineus longissimus TaxID=88925 RepID=UPI00315D5B3F